MWELVECQVVDDAGHLLSCTRPDRHAHPVGDAVHHLEIADDRGRIDEATAATLEWRPVPLEPGDLLFFDSYTPHFSETNRTGRPRRAAYLTYNSAGLGDHRERYYADKRAEFARAGDDFEGERVRISISDDFLGRPVERQSRTTVPDDDVRD